MRASRTAAPSDSGAPHAALPNLWVVYEAGHCQLVVLDVARGEVVQRLPSRPALLKDARASPDGRFLYVGSQDGWVTQYDLRRLAVLAEIRVGRTLRHLALSSDGRVLAAASEAPSSLVLLSADLQPLKQMAVGTLDGKQTSRIAALRDAPPRKSFIAALADVPQLWEISYDEGAAPIFDGYVHDYRMGEAIAKPGYLTPRRAPLDEPVAEFAFDAGHHNILGSTRSTDAAAGRDSTVKIVNLDARRQIAALRLAGQPRMSSSARFVWKGRQVLAIPNQTQGAVAIVDLRSWKLVTSIATPGPGTYVSNHENNPFLWADAAPTESTRDTLALIDKRSLEPSTSLRETGHPLGEVQFSQDGRYAAVLSEGKSGALLVLDPQTSRELRRIPVQQGQWSLPVPSLRLSP